MADEFAKWKAEQAEVWLEHVRALGRDIRRLQREIEFHESLMDVRGVAYDREHVSYSGSGDIVSAVVFRHNELTERYNAELDGYLIEQDEAHRCISKLEDSRYRDVLTYRYLMGYGWEKVGKSAGYEPNYCRELASEARARVYDVMPPQWKTIIPRAD